ncbi:hypothetical protein CROQUDRAFT_33958, partial [Cronartium quercuum f. sp. fusiforme G11]
CKLQHCLNRYTYQPEKCDDQLKKLYESRRHTYENTGTDASSTACPSQKVVEAKLR